MTKLKRLSGVEARLDAPPIPGNLTIEEWRERVCEAFADFAPVAVGLTDLNAVRTDSITCSDEETETANGAN